MVSLMPTPVSLTSFQVLHASASSRYSLIATPEQHAPCRASESPHARRRPVIHFIHPCHRARSGYRTQHTPTSVSCVSHAFLGQACQDRRCCQQGRRAQSLRFQDVIVRRQTDRQTDGHTRHTTEKLSRVSAISIHAAPRSFLCAHTHTRARARAHTHVQQPAQAYAHFRSAEA